MQENKNVLLAVVLSTIVLVGWTFLYEKPKAEQRAQAKKVAQEQGLTQTPQPINAPIKDLKTKEVEKPVATLKSREEIITQSAEKRVKISNESLHGSISLKGARFDDLTLAKYFVTSEEKEEVKLFSPSKSKDRYFADFGWISSDSSLHLPTPTSVWKSSAKTLSDKQPITLSWTNDQKIEFQINIALDENYMFNVTQKVKNNSKNAIAIAPYGRINRIHNLEQKANYIMHEGAIGEFAGILEEHTYQDLIEEGAQTFDGSEGGWFGITDKYWLSSIIPDRSINYKANFSNRTNNQNNIFNTEFVGQEYRVEAAQELEFSHHLFAGAKKVKLLDQYTEEYNIEHFDKAVDFGWLYFLTKPLFHALDFFYKFLGNFGLAILAMTVVIKLALFPMANKSFTAIGRMKKLQPKIEEIKKQYKEDRVALNREMMALYKREKVNPAAGCLPLLLQIPIFFALYKVLYVALDMRQAPFYGWIKDLSAPDPTSIFNLFGLLPFEPAQPFMIGIWPILMGLTMFLQQKLSPSSTDPVQAKVLKFMPYILTFVLAAFPAGLVIYWTWSNSLSILQQWVITRKLNKES